MLKLFCLFAFQLKYLCISISCSAELRQRLYQTILYLTVIFYLLTISDYSVPER